MVDLGSILWDIDPKSTILSGLVLLFLYLFFQVLKRFSPTLEKNKAIQKKVRKQSELPREFLDFVKCEMFCEMSNVICYFHSHITKCLVGSKEMWLGKSEDKIELHSLGKEVRGSGRTKVSIWSSQTIFWGVMEGSRLVWIESVASLKETGLFWLDSESHSHVRCASPSLHIGLIRTAVLTSE